jgi:hypothetical protein
LVLPTIEDYAYLVSGAAYRNLIVRLRRRSVARFPLDYPDQNGEFYGYDAGGTTQLFVVAIGWAATSTLAFEPGLYVPRKSDWPHLYRQHIGDSWAEYLSDVYLLCRNRWQYQIPDAARDRAVLRDLCSRALDYENHYLLKYRSFLLRDLNSGERRRQVRSLERLEQIIFSDHETRVALTRFLTEQDAQLAGSARRILATMNHTSEPYQGAK